MNTWHIQVTEDEVIGPLSPAELLKRVRNGDVDPYTMLQKNDSQWVRALEIDGLFEAAGRKPVTHHCPFCGTETHRPPTHCPECTQYIKTTDLEHRVEDQKLVAATRIFATRSTKWSWWQRLRDKVRGLLDDPSTVDK